VNFPHSARFPNPPRYPFTGVDHHWKDHLFATSGATVQLWDTSRSECLQSFEWGADTVTSVRFNPAQHSLLCCLSADRGVTMYDVNSGSALQKMTMQTRANAACWNPMVWFAMPGYPLRASRLRPPHWLRGGARPAVGRLGLRLWDPSLARRSCPARLCGREHGIPGAELTSHNPCNPIHLTPGARAVACSPAPP
jgi:WD40 repeat protein